MKKKPTATLLWSGPDQSGIVARLALFVHERGHNIIHSDNHTDGSTGLFLTRIEWELPRGFGNDDRRELEEAFSPLAAELGGSWHIHYSDMRTRVAVFVSKQDHCLLDLLWRHRNGELDAHIPIVVGNHASLEDRCHGFGAEFIHVPIDAKSRDDAEARQLRLLESHEIDLVVLAKYMQILSNDFLAKAPPVINIHHSFLPAFIGARPYHQAFERGVKVIGATAHYASPELDAGPIIEQDVVRISHRDEVKDLIRKGKDLERVVLARAVRQHLLNRVLVYGNRTVVFE